MKKKNKLKIKLQNAFKQLKLIENHLNNKNKNYENNSSTPTTTTTINGKLLSPNQEEQESLKREDTFLIITNEENRVLQWLKNKIKSVEKYQDKFNKIQKQYEIHQIEII